MSYFEWVQDFSSYFWREDQINARFDWIMKEAFAGIREVAQDNKVSLRTATFIVGCSGFCMRANCAACTPDSHGCN